MHDFGTLFLTLFDSKRTVCVMGTGIGLHSFWIGSIGIWLEFPMRLS